VDPSFAAYSRLEGIPIFVTEIFLVLMVGAIAIRRWREKDLAFEGTPFDLWFGLWVVAGLVELTRGIRSFHNPMLALRDFGLIYYSIFFYVAREVVWCWGVIRQVSVAFVAGTTLRILIANWYYVFSLNFLPGVGVNWPASGQYMSGINGAFMALAVLVGIALWRSVSETRRWSLFAYLSAATFTLTLTQQRSLFISLLLGAACLHMGVWAFRTLKPLALHRLFAGAILAGVLVWLIRVAAGPTPPYPFLSPVRLLLSKTATTVETTGASTLEFTGTARFREDVWREAWRRFSSNPILGEGFGKAFVFFDTGQRKWWTKDARPHNTYLTILYKMGLFGLSIFLGLHVTFYAGVYRSLRKDLPVLGRSHLLAFAVALFSLQVYGLFNLLIESPFLALVYWSLMGVIHSVIRWGTPSSSPQAESSGPVAGACREKAGP